jgi:prolyl-tRNA synthetase
MPIYRNDEERAKVFPYCQSLAKELGEQTYDGGKVQVHLDDRDISGGDKKWQHIKRGVPVSLEIGPRDIEKNGVFGTRRDTLEKLPKDVNRSQFVATIGDLLGDIQKSLFARALKMREDNTRAIDKLDDFKAYFTPKNEERPEIHGGFALCHFTEDQQVQELLKSLKVTIRCLPVDQQASSGKCIFTGKPTTQRAIFAKAY